MFDELLSGKVPHRDFFGATVFLDPVFIEFQLNDFLEELNGVFELKVLTVFFNELGQEVDEFLQIVVVLVK